MSLGAFAYNYPGAWLIGGPRIACEALEVRLVDEVHICQVRDVSIGRGATEPVAFDELLRRMGYLTGLGATRLDDVDVYHWRKPDDRG